MLVGIFFVMVCLLLFVVIILGIVFQLLMIQCRKPEITLFDKKILFNPFNLQFFGQKYLSEKGIYWRNKSWLCFGAFFITIIIMFLNNQGQVPN
jgi:hypothetical protein